MIDNTYFKFTSICNNRCTVENIYKQLYAVLWICDILVWIQIHGSVPLTNRSGSESCKFIAHFVHSNNHPFQTCRAIVSQLQPSKRTTGKLLLSKHVTTLRTSYQTCTTHAGVENVQQLYYSCVHLFRNITWVIPLVNKSCQVYCHYHQMYSSHVQ